MEPDDAKTHNILGAALTRVPGRFFDGIRQFEEAVRLDPSMAPAHFNLARALAEAGGSIEGGRSVPRCGFDPSRSRWRCSQTSKKGRVRRTDGKPFGMIGCRCPCFPALFREFS